jgi:hypothetical protein
VILCLVGLVWILQGSNIIHGSGMSGHHQWLISGVVIFVIGVAFLATARRFRGHQSD